MANCFKGLGIIRGGNYRFFVGSLSDLVEHIECIQGKDISVESKSLKIRVQTSILSNKAVVLTN